MIIIKAPKFSVCKCICGTVFQPEIYDELQYRFDNSNMTEYEVYARCPTCSTLNEVTTEKDGEEKKQTAERQFTPEDVCKMSPKEVQENYTAIMKSMKKWR
jgi:hypothetical protein